MADFLTDAKKHFGFLTESKETGFFYPYILEVIKWYEKKEIPILGGDVYIRRDKKYSPTGDWRDVTYVPDYANWCFEFKDIKNSYLKESIAAARAYISNYPDKENALFVLVPN